MALGKLIDRKWTTEWTEHNQDGQFQRMPTVFHNWISRDGASGFKAEAGRYHLYISLGCPWATNFYPVDLQVEIDRVLDAIYQPINNGVYRSGFAVSQAAYTEAVTELFTALEHWEVVLGKQPYLCGERITIADWCLFTTLFRFDLAYYGLFKCNLKRLIDLPNLWNYCRKLYRYPGVRFSVGEANANGLQCRTH